MYIFLIGMTQIVLAEETPVLCATVWSNWNNLQDFHWPLKIITVSSRDFLRLRATAILNHFCGLSDRLPEIPVFLFHPIDGGFGVA
ncbi:hypothetical protein D3C81_2114950 [compost metagenome]